LDERAKGKNPTENLLLFYLSLLAEHKTEELHMPFFKDLLRDGAKINSLSENLENSLFFVSLMCKLIKLIFNRVKYRQSD
jgi:hypothetical protein